MKAIRVHEFGKPDNIILEEIRDPDPGPGLSALRSARLQIYVLWQPMVFQRRLFHGPSEN